MDFGDSRERYALGLRSWQARLEHSLVVHRDVYVVDVIGLVKEHFRVCRTLAPNLR